MKMKESLDKLALFVEVLETVVNLNIPAYLIGLTMKIFLTGFI